jgi:hypothetical protein
MRKWIVQALIPILGGVSLLVGILALGYQSRQSLRDNGHFTIPFSDLNCVPPDTLSRADFLGEVQYLASLPDQLNLLDDYLATRLAAAFRSHPWVEDVQQIKILPNRQVQIQLKYRTPILAIPVRELDATADSRIMIRGQSVPGRVVDHQGILLPRTTVRIPLIVLRTEVALPTGRAGTVWGDDRVTAAAHLAAYLEPYQDRLELEEIRIEGGTWVLTTRAARILWGHPPGQEPEEEAPAVIKIQRLLEYRDQHSRLDGQEHDVRPKDQSRHRPLTRKL